MGKKPLGGGREKEVTRLLSSMRYFKFHRLLSELNSHTREKPQKEKDKFRLDDRYQRICQMASNIGCFYKS